MKLQIFELVSILSTAVQTSSILVALLHKTCLFLGSITPCPMQAFSLIMNHTRLCCVCRCTLSINNWPQCNISCHSLCQNAPVQLCAFPWNRDLNILRDRCLLWAYCPAVTRMPLASAMKC